MWKNIGLASTTFKQRFSNHKASLAHISNAHKTTLSAHVWDLKEKNAPFSLDWSIVGLAPAYNRKVRKCHLCLLEKSSITFSDPLRTINKRNEIVSKCRHRDKLLLKNWWFFYPRFIKYHLFTFALKYTSTCLILQPSLCNMNSSLVFVNTRWWVQICTKHGVRVIIINKPTYVLIQSFSVKVYIITWIIIMHTA